VLLLCAAALAATVSWGAYVDAFVGLGALASLTLKGRRPGSRALAAAAAAALVFAGSLFLSRPGAVVTRAIRTRVRFLGGTPLRGPVGPLQNADSSRSRLDNAIDSLSYLASHPLGGVGIGQFSNQQISRGRESDQRKNPFTGWLAAAAGMGAGGPLVLAGALGLVLGRARERQSSGGARALSIALILLAAVQALHTGAYLDLAWWFPVALAVVIADSAASSRKSGPPLG
jgi:hypothetical protein